VLGNPRFPSAKVTIAHDYQISQIYLPSPLTPY
jgi:hypothetical protein